MYICAVRRQYVGKAYNVLQRFVCQDNGNKENSMALWQREEDYVRHGIYVNFWLII